MRSVTYSMGVSVDGYIVGPDGGFGWTAPDEEVFRFATDEIRQAGVHLLGRRLYETMLYWETADQDPSLDATLAAEAAALGLVDEYRARVHPVLVGGGIPFFPQRERRVDLELLETRTFNSRVVYLRYRLAR
jgi:dihydrofolate reductase